MTMIAMPGELEGEFIHGEWVLKGRALAFVPSKYVFVDPKKPPTQRERCGNTTGYRDHARANEYACDACKAASSAYQIERRRKVREGQ